jgi:glucose-1-phosphate thymidylyltransferase
MMISCPEEIAYRMGYITCEDLMACGQGMKGNSYGQYLIRLAETEWK